jgi:hypothetical protein
MSHRPFTIKYFAINMELWRALLAERPGEMRGVWLHVPLLPAFFQPCNYPLQLPDRPFISREQFTDPINGTQVFAETMESIQVPNSSALSMTVPAIKRFG